MTQALQGWNVEVTHAEHGLEALQAIRQGRADLLFLDLNMPIMDGYEVLERIRRDDLQAMVIVVSGDIQPEAHDRVMALGALAFIKKPTSPQEVSDVLRRFGLLSELQQPQALAADRPEDLPEYYQEIANVAMGRAGDLLARLLNVFVTLPIPEVRFVTWEELNGQLHEAAEQQIHTVCQGFVGLGIAGEALLLFRDSNFEALARLLRADPAEDSSLQAELLMEMANTLIAAFLGSLEQQLDMSFGRASPILLSDFDGLAGGDNQWQRALSITIRYEIKQYDIQCELMLVFTEDSTCQLEQMAAYF
ncbi:response regulator [Marinobacterium sp. CAU 1594]|nr:response regulator [Marinobacterium arenosum]